MIRFRHILCLAVSLTGSVSVARADSTTGAAVAEALFRDAVHLLAADKVDEACPKFLESQAIDPSLGTLLYLAACHERQGRTASAWSEFTSARDWAERTNQGERAAFALRHIPALEARLSNIVISLPTQSIPGWQLKVDGGVLSIAVAGTALPLDPGQHTIAVEAQGYAPWHTTVTIPAQPGKTDVMVPELEPLSAAVLPVPTTPVSNDSVSTVLPIQHSGSSLPMWTAVGFGGAGVVAGSIFGGVAMSARDSAQAACHNNRCTQDGLSDIDRAKTFATVSTVAFGVGIGGALVAGYLAFRRTSEPPHRDGSALFRTLTVTPIVSPSVAGLSVDAILY